MEKHKKSHRTTINLRYLLQHDGSYSISDIQDYFEYLLKNHGEKTVNP